MKPPMLGILLCVVVAVLAGGALLARATPSGNPVPGATLLGPLPHDPDAADKATIAALRKAGSDVSRPTNIRHYLYVPTQREAEEAAVTLRARGYSAEVQEPLGKLSDGSVSNDWSVVAQTTAVPSMQTFRKSRPLFHQLAMKYHGKYDGWEAAVQK